MATTLEGSSREELSMEDKRVVIVKLWQQKLFPGDWELSYEEGIAALDQPS